MSAHRDRAIALLFDFNRPTEAEQAIREGLAVEPNDALLHCLLSHSLRRQRRSRDAIASAETAIQLAPENAYAQATLGWALLNKSRLKGAARAFAEAARIEPDNVEHYYGWAETLRIAGLLKKARKIAEAGLTLEPRHIGCRNTLGLCLMNSGQFKAAGQWFEESRAIDPSEPSTHAMLGWLSLHDKKRPLRAARHYLEALRLNPSSRENQKSLDNAVRHIGVLFGGLVFALFAGIVAMLALAASESLLSNVVDNIAGVSILMLGPLGALMLRRRFRETLILLPFPLGQALRSADDRRYLLAAISAWLATGVLTTIVGLTAHQTEKEISELVPYLATCVFPLAPIVVWLDRRHRSLDLVAVGCAFCSIAQVVLIVLGYTDGGTPGANRLVGPAMLVSGLACGLIVAGNNVDD